MIFISRKPEYTTYIRRDVPGVIVNIHGQTEATSLQPALVVQFQPKQLTPAQRIRADLRFKELNRQSPYGAVPYTDGGVMGEQFAEYIEGAEAYKGYDPSFQLGKFDTATDIDYAGQPESPEEIRKMVEEALLRDSSLNVDFILLDGVELAAPWPNYPLEGQGRHKKIAAVVRELGLDPRVVIEFEQSQDHPGAGVISELEALIAGHDEAQAEEDALSVPVIQ